MIWRIRAKSRQPNFVHDGATDHPDRLGPNGINGEWIEFEQNEPPYFPGEETNDPFERSKFALSHIWHEVSARIHLRKHEVAQRSCLLRKPEAPCLTC